MVPESAPITATADQFFDRFRLGGLLKQAGITKQGGERPARLLKFLLMLVFTQRNFYRILDREDPDTPKKDTVYRFLASPRYQLAAPAVDDDCCHHTVVRHAGESRP